jgi:hypothetical protein
MKAVQTGSYEAIVGTSSGAELFKSLVGAGEETNSFGSATLAKTSNIY